MDFCCPICKGVLSPVNRSYKCPTGHSFDLAKSGYLNLLLNAGGSTHGDNREMLAARRDFLNTGHYLPLAERVCALASEHFPPLAAVLDAGCGEGYYTDKLERALFLRDGESRVSAFDISKDALRFVAARNKNVTCAVASAYDVPARDAVFSAVVNMFSPLALEETRRILGTGGIFLIAFPAEEHLFGLKAAIYDTPYKNEPLDFSLDGFELILSERVRYTMELSSKEEIKSLFMMTPYAYRTSAANKKRIEELTALETDADFYICVYRKRD